MFRDRGEMVYMRHTFLITQSWQCSLNAIAQKLDYVFHTGITDLPIIMLCWKRN